MARGRGDAAGGRGDDEDNDLGPAALGPAGDDRGDEVLGLFDGDDVIII